METTLTHQGVVDCFVGWMGEKCEIPCTHGEQDPPNSGFCRCYDCYTGTSCDVECSQHGSCNGSSCVCQEGYKGKSIFMDNLGVGQN